MSFRESTVKKSVRGTFSRTMTSEEMDEVMSGEVWDCYYECLGKAYAHRPNTQAGGRLITLDYQNPELAAIPLDNCPFDDPIQDAYAVLKENVQSKAINEYCIHNLAYHTILKAKQVNEVIHAFGLSSSFKVTSEGVNSFANLLLHANGMSCNAATYFADSPLFSGIGSAELNLVLLSLLEGNMLQLPMDEKWKLLFNTLWTMLYGGLPGTGSAVLMCDNVPASIAENSTFIPCVMGQPAKRMPRSRDDSGRVWVMVQSEVIPKERGADPRLGTDVSSLCMGLGWPNLQNCYTGASQSGIVAEKMACAAWCAEKTLPPSAFLPLASRNEQDKLNLYQIAYNRGCRIGTLNATTQEEAFTDRSKVPKNAVSFNRIMKYTAGHEVWYGRYGMMVKLFLLANLFINVAAHCVAVENRLICSLHDWINVFGVNHSQLGPYRVCFGDDCILRYRIGTNKKADPYDINNIYPFRCPSPDWEPKIINSSYETQCTQCGAHVHGGYCEYGNVRKGTQNIKVITPNHWNLIISKESVTFGEFAEFPNNFSHSGGEVVYPRTTSHDPYPYSTVKWFKVVTAILTTLSTVITITVASGATYKVKLDDEELDLDGNDVKVVGYRRIKFPKWLMIVSFVITIACCFVNAMAAIDTNTLLDVDVHVSGFNLPSECSCSNPGDVISQLRCITSCDSSLQIDNLFLQLAFGVKVQCESKYLVILQEYREVIDKACFRAGNEAVLRYYCQKASYCEIMEEGGLGYSNYDQSHKCGYHCAFGYNLYRYANWKLSIFPAQMCYYNVNPEGGIAGLPPGINYTSVIHSDLVSQNVVLHVVINGINHVYKVTNGELGSDRAWIVSPQCIIGGNLSSNCWLHQRLRSMVNGDRSNCGTPFNHLLPSFTPTTISDACTVDIQFNNMRCFMATKLNSCRYTVIGNVTMCQALEDGMIEGQYVGQGKSVRMPSSWKKCGNCTASKTICEYPWMGDEECVGLWINETFDDNQTEFIGDWAVIIEDVSDVWTWILGGISFIVILIIVIIILVECVPSCMMKQAMRSVPLSAM